ncbi:hypothetical protein A5784_10670 [Mycobacterium sp. 852013-50091_SCH5140682]|uniref:hypothetical protein n=1 Tax=Mycobacterium sp. 852013-50091_SCH5140682 TaxID=1834109 RepID=UPI0007EA4E6E|nr:hypothetical protein [Mycobacterium sp. 852013-50091_SCH5140682]OBC05835.1 hypothetical protein A5784_10670 [Mycobacterium sp. 852013-50091_SCH5140682]
MTDALTLTVFCLICGAAGVVLATAHRARRACYGDDEATERLMTIDELVAAFDEMFLRKGLITGGQLALIRTGTHAVGVVTGMRATGTTREDFREVELDLMVSRPGGGQFPAIQTALVPATSLPKVAPGSVIDAYYRPGDESTIAVFVSPA